MTKVSFASTTAFPDKHSQAKEEDEEEDEEEDDMASHSAEDPVRPAPQSACDDFTAVDPHADSFPKVRRWLDWPSGFRRLHRSPYLRTDIGDG